MIFFIYYLIILNTVSLLLMFVDKRKAKKRKSRIPEKTLFTLALLGGSAGVYLGMYFFHHKTRHSSFTLGIPVIIIIQILLLGYLMQNL
ncbi:DUF1294 domain-containing protein [Thermovenabulum sp.]|uniref:DUF1294 domain-containing protein n=1 Tax=Thermovenabulum sp. TaxID=3100335 RepID=UPI003C7DD405